MRRASVLAAELTPFKRQALGAVTAAVVVGYGARHEFGMAWGVAVGVCAVLVVFGLGMLGDQLGRRRTGGH